MNQKDHHILIHSTISLKYIDDRCFHCVFMLTQHCTEIKNHAEQVSNIKTFLDLYNFSIYLCI